MKMTNALNLLTLIFLSTNADASYLRFWRGEKRVDLTAEQFQTGLNSGLLPATGKLAETSAKLFSYYPALIKSDLVEKGLPSEVALVEYESEASYKSYRATAEGQGYADLHWDFFNKAQSKSLVPEKYVGTIEIEKAYDIVGGEFNKADEASSFRTYQRPVNLSNEEYISFVKSHIDQVSKSNPNAFVLLVAQNYIMEYVKWDNQGNKIPAGESVIVDNNLELKSKLEFGEAIRFK